MFVKANLVTSNNQPESRMREIRQSGSEGREAELNRPSLPRSLRLEHDLARERAGFAESVFFLQPVCGGGFG